MTPRATVDPWFMFSPADANARLCLFCFPHAGGGASVFHSWQETLSTEVQVCAVQLPGRQTRLQEPAATNLPQLVDDLARALLPYSDIPFAFFGHSMGALIAFELTRKLRRENGPMPRRLFLASSSAPQIAKRHPQIYALPEREFVEALQHRSNIPAQALQHSELMQLLLPTLRADFALCDTYEYLPEEPLHLPIHAFGGLEDQDVTKDDLQAWSEQTRDQFTLQMFVGNHFFIDGERVPLLRAMSEYLER